MRMGKRDTPIIIERPVRTEDSVYGTPLIQWVPLDPLPGSPTTGDIEWAEFTDMLPSRSESVLQGLEVAKNQSRVRINYREDVDSTMRILRLGVGAQGVDQTYQIVGGPAMVGRREELEFVVEKYSS